MLGKTVVAGVVPRYRHHRPGAVPRQNVVRHPNGQGCPGKRMARIRTGKRPVHCLHVRHAVPLRFPTRCLAHGRYRVRLLGRNQGVQTVHFRCNSQIGNAKQGVWAGGEDRQLGGRFAGTFRSQAGTLPYIKMHQRAFASANPVPLAFLDGVAPVQPIQAVQQFLGIGRNPHAPLHHLLLDNGVAAAFRKTVFDFVVGQHSSQGRAPIHPTFRPVGQAVVLQHRLPVCAAQVLEFRRR